MTDCAVCGFSSADPRQVHSKGACRARLLVQHRQRLARQEQLKTMTAENDAKIEGLRKAIQELSFPQPEAA